MDESNIFKLDLIKEDVFDFKPPKLDRKYSMYKNYDPSHKPNKTYHR